MAYETRISRNAQDGKYSLRKQRATTFPKRVTAFIKEIDDLNSASDSGDQPDVSARRAAFISNMKTSLGIA